jgi:hypothetical protein
MDINAAIGSLGVRPALAKAEAFELMTDSAPTSAFHNDLAWAYIACGEAESAQFALRRSASADRTAAAVIAALLEDNWPMALAAMRNAPKTVATAAAQATIEAHAVASYAKVYRDTTAEAARKALGITSTEARADVSTTSFTNPSLMQTVARSSMTFRQPIERL